MSFDPTLPVNGSAVSSSELREQLNALKALIDGLQTQITGLDATITNNLALRPTTEDVEGMIVSLASANVNSHDGPTFPISDPPTQLEVEQVRDKLNELYEGLHTA